MNREERFVTPAERPDDHVHELLTILMEECAEVIQRASKAKRFGLAEVQPGQPYTNSYRLALEIGDIFAVVDALEKRDAVVYAVITEGTRIKCQKLKQFMQSEIPHDRHPDGREP